MNNSKIKSKILNKILSYIIETEEESFANDPSDSHIYYLALRFKHGKRYADNQLLCAEDKAPLTTG